MKVLVCGATGCVGQAVVRALRSRGHQVVQGLRQGDSQQGQGWRLDFMAPVAPEAWAQRLVQSRIDAVVNCVGILLPRGGQRFERVHAEGPAELFRGAALAARERALPGLPSLRVVQISALGAANGTSPYLRSKRAADEALLALPLQATVLRPTLIYGPGCASARVFATLASLPVVALPGGGGQALQPIHVFEVAEIVARCLEGAEPAAGVFDIGGGDVLSHRSMLAAYRQALCLGDALWLPLPMAAMRLTAHAAEALPQQVLCRDTMDMLAQGNVPAHNAAADLLGRAPTQFADGLRVSPPQPLLDLRVQLSPLVATGLRLSLALMWLWTAAVSALLPQDSGVLALLARCGFEGRAGVAMLLLSCTLNAGLGLAMLGRPGPKVHALQAATIIGYTAIAAFHMPELALDHCAPLVKNLPLLAAVLVLWLGLPAGSPQPTASWGSGGQSRQRHAALAHGGQQRAV